MNKREIRYNKIPSSYMNKPRECKICKVWRRTTNRENPYVCEIDLRTLGRDLILNRYWIGGIGIVVGVLIGLIL